MPDSFNSAGADASTGIMGFLAALDAQKRQKRLDDLTQQQQAFDQHIKSRDMSLKEAKEQRETEQHKADLAERATQHATQAEQIAENVKAKKTQTVEKQLGGMVRGDYPDAQLIQSLDELGMGSQAPKPGLNQQSLPGVVAPNAPAMGAAPVSAGIRVAAQPHEPSTQIGLTGASDPVVRPYAGSPKEREAIDSRKRQQAFIDTMPEGDPRRDELKQGLEAEAAGLKVPPGFFSKQTQNGRQLILDADTGTFKDSTGQTVTDPSKADTVHVLPRKPDSSARDASHELAQQRINEQARARAYTSFDSMAKPVQEDLRNVAKMSTALDQNSNIADSTIAEQVLKMTAGGSGSGLRLTQPLIDQILHGSRSKWDDLSQKLKGWSGDPKDLVLTPDQKASIRLLGAAIKTRASAVHGKIIGARRIVDDPSSDPASIHKAVTDLEDLLNTDEAPATTAPAPATGGKRIRYGMDGKVIP